MAPEKINGDQEFDENEGQSPEDADMEKEFASLLAEHLPSGPEQARGDVIEVYVVSVGESMVLVDVGGKAEARIPIDEFPLIGDKRDVREGQMIPVVQIGRSDDGAPRLSHRQARVRAAQRNIREAMEKKVPVQGTISSIVKGGVMVDIGLEAFMPASQVDLFKIPDLNKMIGQQVEAYVIEFDPRRNRAVLSRRQLLFERRESLRKDFMERLAPGSLVTGKVKSTLDFGVFVELGMVDGFIPREEVSWDRGKSPADVLKAGEEVEVRVLSISPETGKVTLTRKRLTDNPWDQIPDRYPVGSVVRGKVIALQPYGAFVHLEEGITGMIHASDMSWDSGNKKPQDYVREGDEVTAQVLEVNQDKKRLSLGLKQLSRDPWSDAVEKFTVGTRVKGPITSIIKHGAFVRLTDNVEGMVHVSDITWEKRVNHPSDFLKVGEEVEVVVLKVDSTERRISLGIKQLQDSPYDAFLKAHPVGTVVKGKVTRFAPFGAFVELSPSLEGLIHISQIDEKRVELPEKALKVGEEVTVKIVGAEKKNQKISLSRREAIKAAERENVKQYMSKKTDQGVGMSLGDALRAAQGKKE